MLVEERTADLEVATLKLVKNNYGVTIIRHKPVWFHSFAADMAPGHDPGDMLARSLRRIPAVEALAVESHLVVLVYFETGLPSLVADRGLMLGADF